VAAQAARGRFGVNEREMEVLQQYPFQVGRLSRVRGAFLCETREGLCLLRETGSLEKRLLWENSILTRLQETGRIRVDTYVENCEGSLITESSDHRRFCVKKWYEGRECDMGSPAEIIFGMEVLGRLHQSLQQISLEQEDRNEIWPNWQEELEKHSRELNRTRNYIRKKRHKSDLELQMLADFPYYCGQAEAALKLFRKQESLPVLLCHGNYTHHHLLYSGDGVSITEFSRMNWGVQQEDLYLFLRKAMEKHNWDIGLGLSMLAHYEKIRSMNAAERRFLFIRLFYPEKFWKQVNYYYNRKKSWVPLRNLEKLQVLQEQRQKKEQFLARLQQEGYV